jgi:ribosomal protein S15P/S13E
VKETSEFREKFGEEPDEEKEDELHELKKNLQKKVKEAKKSYCATKFEFKILPTRQISEIEKALEDIVKEVRTLQSLKPTESYPKDDFEKKLGKKIDSSELSKFKSEYKKEREYFKPEKEASPYGSINANFTEDERIKLGDVEYAIRKAISLGGFTQLTTIPELELFDEKKKEWEKLEKKREKLRDKVNEKVKELETDGVSKEVINTINVNVEETTGDKEIDFLKGEIKELQDKFEAYKKDHKSRFKQEMPVDTMTEYIRIKIDRGTRPQEYFFTLYFEDSCRIPPKYDDQAAFDNEDDKLGNLSDLKPDEIKKILTGLSLKTYVKRKFFRNSKKEFEETFEPPPPPDTAITEEIREPETEEDKKALANRRLQKIHDFCASKCADRLEDYVFRGSFAQHVKDLSFAECKPTGYDWLMADCLNTIDFVPYILKCELIIFLGCSNERALAYWKSRGRKFYHFVYNYVDRIISELKRNEDEPDLRDFVKGWLKGFVLLVQYALFGFTETYDIFERILSEKILDKEPLYQRALIDVFLASWGLVEFIRDPLQDKANQLSSQTSKTEFDRLGLPKEEPGKGILVKPPRSYWQEVMSGRMDWETLKKELSHIFNILRGFKPHPINNDVKLDEEERFTISTTWKRSMTNRKKKENEIIFEGKEGDDDEKKKDKDKDGKDKDGKDKDKEAEEKKLPKEKKKSQWAQIIYNSPLFESTDAYDFDTETNVNIFQKEEEYAAIKSSLPDDHPFLKEDKVWQFFQRKVLKNLFGEKYVSDDQFITKEYFVKELASTEKAQKALKFISQFQDVLNIMHTLLSMNEHRDEMLTWIMRDWQNPKTEVTDEDLNQNLQRALIDCIVDLSIFREGRLFFQKMLKHLAKQVSEETKQLDDPSLNAEEDDK